MRSQARESLLELRCDVCNDPNPQAEPNTPDGKYVCRSCRDLNGIRVQAPIRVTDDRLQCPYCDKDLSYNLGDACNRCGGDLYSDDADADDCPMCDALAYDTIWDVCDNCGYSENECDEEDR